MFWVFVYWACVFDQHVALSLTLFGPGTTAASGAGFHMNLLIRGRWKTLDSVRHASPTWKVSLVPPSLLASPEFVRVHRFAFHVWIRITTMRQKGSYYLRCTENLLTDGNKGGTCHRDVTYFITNRQKQYSKETILS